MRTLYPEIQVNQEYLLEVGQGHRIHVEESGNPNGIPVLFVHGGPGGGCSPTHRRFFNPEKYRIILFDQRGCGRSTPHASLKQNTTDALISDMEQIRVHLGIERWLLFGGSWGSTLSLVYAQAHPERVCGLILRGIFLCRERDIGWFYQDGASFVFPDFWQDYLEPIPKEERNDLLTAYYERLTSDNELVRMAAAKAWSVWEGRCSTLDPNPEIVDHFADPHFALAMARIEAHYFINGAFIRPNQILDDADRLKEIPLTIVHGRYDMVCPVEQAFALQQAVPHAELHIVRDAGHSAFEPGISDNLVRATDRFAESLA
ncbi:prolyl aminopeptidase [Marinobacterium lutimaris]|uniref:Proline iminopeptidase n=1 Tax=Marinobacterium lutimaris TaxID=568106 RepID=A0A1H6BLH9_9GAMM|nr:prolyl aminopeptidase [Marinobacterium lutimaris]SEG61581.1 prolyl aminopeptidase Serine peptidase. MEROPS family S33 [Marinobacterium lutimaris]